MHLLYGEGNFYPANPAFFLHLSIKICSMSASSKSLNFIEHIIEEDLKKGFPREKLLFLGKTFRITAL